ncbi:heparinase II/III family protein [Microbulbifer salipaludis]|uniref:Heparinase II/III family protein n=1 Tax=Microbulbifer salipaludis TaxID=187980 RepID=A0ABS3E941_9GAMM|nr:heparinase II/III family protein [Microbulbifer salipaludis]MBN8431786.1 heparinase II/III family protein [Microbulbifer salipaludis]
MEYTIVNFEQHSVIPVETFLHRIFPAGLYESDKNRIVRERIFKPRKDCEELALTLPVDWEAVKDSSDRNWRMQLQGWTMFHPVMNFFDSYEDKNEIVDYFLAIARDWYGQYKNDPDNVTTSRMPSSYAWYDMSVGFRALILAFMINRIGFFKIPLSEADRDILRCLAEKHIANLSSEETFSLNNHGIFQIHGLLALLTVLGADETDDNVGYALARMEELVSSQFDASGIHLEHSPHYHFYVLSTFLAVIKSGWYARSDLIEGRINQAQTKKKWLVDPLKRPVCVGDSILTVQDSVDFSGENFQESFCISDFHESGYGIVRSAWHKDPNNSSMLFLTAAYHSKSHKHRDCMSFEWFESGEKIICDSGKYGYRSDRYRNYFLSARAHNSVEIEGFDILKIKPYGSALNSVEQVSENIFRFNANLDYPAIKHSRDIYFKPGCWVVVVDDLDFVRERGFTQWFHLDKRFHISSLLERSLYCLDSSGNEIYIDCLNGSVSPIIHYGDDKNLQGFISENDYCFSPALALGFKGFGKSEKLVTALSLTEDNREDALAFVAHHIEPELLKKTVILNERSSKSILPNIQHQVYLDASAFSRAFGERTNRVYIDNVPLTFYSSFSSECRKVILMLPGATKRSKGIYDFQRHSWANDFKDFDIISFSDPSIRDDNNISIGWFQNSEKAYGIDALIKFVQLLIERDYYKPEDITIFGSSAGGFAGLKLANELPKCPVIAINPQLYLERYTPSHFLGMLESCYPGLDRNQVVKKYSTRLSVNLDGGARESPVCIFQNVHDESHLLRHLKPMINRYKGDITEFNFGSGSVVSKTGLNIVYYDDPELGHSPPNKETTLKMIALVTQSMYE